MQSMFNLIFYIFSIIICSIFTIISILAIIFMQKSTMPLLLLSLMGISLFSFLQLLTEIIFLMEGQNKSFKSIISLLAKLTMYIGIEMDFILYFFFLYCIVLYKPWGSGDDAYLFSTIFIVFSFFKTIIVYTSSYNAAFFSYSSSINTQNEYPQNIYSNLGGGIEEARSLQNHQ